ncbi:MAG: bacillithiol biosynthesis deacetylase BshB1 [Ferruginibacter sp.]
MKIDVLAFGVHPDDVELGGAGVLLVEKMKGKKTGIIDLTAGELGTRGNAEIRNDEAAAAAEILGVDIRENLGFADGFFQNDKAHQLKVIEAIRKYRPEIILCNAPEDRHPDHGRSAKLVVEAAFLSGLAKIETFSGELQQQEWRPKYVFHYIQDRFLQPSFVLDISAVFDKKMEAVKAYSSQFYNGATDGPQTYISTKGFLESVEGRCRMFGKMIGVEYAEGFITEKMIGVHDMDAFILENT